jgi:hypothetical protein
LKTGNFVISRKGAANINRVEGLVMHNSLSGKFINIVDSNKSLDEKIALLKSEFGSKKK